MNTRPTGLLLVAVLALGAWSEPAAAQVCIEPPPPCTVCPPPPRDPVKSNCPDPDEFYLLPPRPSLYVVADGMALRRDANGDLDVAALNNFGNVVLSTRDLPFDFSGGARVTVGTTLDECFQLEGTYFSLAQYDEALAIRNATTNALGTAGNLFSPFSNFGQPAVAGLDYNNFASIAYQGSLDNLELNLRRRLPMPPGKLAASILFGVRYMDAPERFQYATESAVPVGVGTSNFVRVETRNELIGPQIGALFEFYAENRWWVNVEIKGALCNNHTGQNTLYQTGALGAAAASFATAREDDTTAFVGDLALTFVYRWSPHFTTRLGYQAIWLEGMALASENFRSDVQILRDGPGQLSEEGGVVFHGPHAGIMLSW